MWGLLIPRMEEIMRNHGCELHHDFPNPVCVFGDTRVEINIDQIAYLAKLDQYEDIEKYLLTIINKAKGIMEPIDD